MRLKLKGLWLHPDFMKLWTGETISLFGSEITSLAVPLTAVLLLKATPVEMGVLGALHVLPFLLLSLFAGIWVDRLRRRPILITANLGRALLIFSIPLMYWLGVLVMEYLYIVGLLTGILTVFFDISYQSYLPTLVEREKLVEGNSKLEISRSLAHIAGPGIAGVLVQLITAPIAMLLDAFSFLVSAFFLRIIKTVEPAKQPSTEKRNIWKEIGEGLGLVFGSRYLRSIAGCAGTSNFFANMITAVFTLYVIRELKLEPTVLGIIFAAGSFGALLGALLSGKAASRFRLGHIIVGMAFLSGVATFMVPLAGVIAVLAIPLLISGYFLAALSITLYNINQVSLRQAITPDRLQGRMNASMRFLVWGTMPIGSITGGILGEILGVQLTLVIAAIGSATAFLWVYYSPVRALVKQPEPVGDKIPEPVEVVGKNSTTLKK
jgi:MFS family permease